MGEDKAVLLSRIEELEKQNKDMEIRLYQIQSTNTNDVEVPPHPIRGDITEKEEVKIQSETDLSQQIAMKQLEVKFTRTMKDIADLEDEKQRLEHLVMQLQDETETIGEYVTLYQHQRGILKQRALERDEQVFIVTLFQRN